MITVNARCTCGPREPFLATTFERRDPRPGDVLFDIAGIVSAVGSEVTRFKVGDRVGVGKLVDACRTYGGYSEKIVVDQGFVVRIPDSLPLESGAEVEVIDADQIDDAYRRLLAGDVRFRFVIENSTLRKG